MVNGKVIWGLERRTGGLTGYHSPLQMHKTDIYSISDLTWISCSPRPQDRSKDL